MLSFNKLFLTCLVFASMPANGCFGFGRQAAAFREAARVIKLEEELEQQRWRLEAMRAGTGRHFELIQQGQALKDQIAELKRQQAELMPEQA